MSGCVAVSSSLLSSPFSSDPHGVLVLAKGEDLGADAVVTIGRRANCRK